MKILILTAMTKERQMFLSMENNKYWGEHTVNVRQCGIGKVNAAMNTTKEILSLLPDVVISSGVAGGCGENIDILDTVVGERVSYHDVWCGKPNVLGQIQGMPSEFVAPSEILNKIKCLKIEKIKFGKIVSGDWFIDTKEKMHEIQQNFPDVMAVDMESSAIAQVCHTFNVPFLPIRVISDLPLRENNTKQYKDFWENISKTSFDTVLKVIECIKNI